MRHYNHLFFDLDHTLWDFDTNAHESLTEIYSIFELSKKGVAPFEDFYGHYIQHNQVLWANYHNGIITAEELKWKRMWRTLLEFKIGDEQLARQMSDSFMQILPSKKSLFPHTIDVLNYLKEKKYKLHLITNGFEITQWNKLRSSGLDGYFDQVITSETSNSLKPKKEIFEYALLKAGATLKESIMLGDNLEADIQGAINAGMDCVFVNHINETTTLNPTYTVSDLKELLSIF